MTIRCIDIETTGIDPDTDAVVEIASVDLLREGGITNSQEVLVRPGIAVPPESSAVHHLIDADLANAPLLEEVIDRFKGAEAYVAHNCDFERSFLGEYLGEPTWICTYKCALRVWPDLISHSNQALRYTLGLINPHGIDRQILNPHRALSDVIVTSAIFEELLKQAKWSELVRWSSEPPLLTVLGFGKHRGQRFDAAPRDYLEWIADGQNDLREDVKFSARYWLAKGLDQDQTATPNNG
jgi:exodeoxyribonuclease X